ncbi:MAG: hypothetical protein JNG89_17000 [Planctomycetaceae bacterium]|nr:hypothetical protein [Planctomycetaceae bacterium]
MPEKEFELYLSLLVRLLRLSPEQKSSIERELRDHFEERFEDLVRRGMPRDEAIQRTLDEFGDVAGLAGEFTQLSRRNIRRRIMQGTAATAGIAAAVVIWATLFRGPEPAGGPAPMLIAQDVTAAGDAATHAAPAAEATSELGVDIRAGAVFDGRDAVSIDPGQFLPEKFREPISIEFQGTPLRDVLAYIADATQLPILFDMPALNEEGITGDEEVSMIQTGPLHTALDILLHNVNQVELAWIQDAEVIRITTKDKADDLKTTQYYNIRDLLEAGHTRDGLRNVVLEATEGPWEPIDGIGGTVSGYGDLLVVKQCQRTQLDVACTLAALRTRGLVRTVGVLQSHYRIGEALDSPTSIEFAGTPVRDVISYISEMHDIPVVLDTSTLSEEGISGDEEVSLAVNGIKLSNALRLLLENINQVELDVIIRNGALWVTTKDEADEFLQTVIYDVADITENDSILMEQLENVIENETRGPWESLHGIGGLMLKATDGLLVCRQTPRMQVDVYSLIGAIRGSMTEAGGSPIEPTVAPLETRFYRMDAQAAHDVASLLPQLIEPGSWRGIVGDPATMNPIGTIHTLAAGRMLLSVDSGALTEAAPPSEAGAALTLSESADANVVVVPQAVLIITHKPSVQRKVRDLLTSLLSEQNHWTWKDHGSDKVKFIAPGFQEGTWPGWNSPLGTPSAFPPGGAGGMGGVGFGGGGGFGGGAGIPSGGLGGAGGGSGF